MSTVLAPGGDAVSLLEDLQPYLTDSADGVSARAYELTFRIASPSLNPAARQRAVDILMNACSSGAGEAPEFLTHFRKEDFTPSAKDSLRKYVRSSASLHLDRLMKLAGYLGLRDLERDIWRRSLPGNAVPVRWAAMLSLARLGNTDAIAAIMTRVRRMPVNDDVVYELFPDLLYTRQADPVAYMVGALQSDDNNCLSADAEKEKPIPCGYRIMELLAPVIAGYPLQLDQSGDLTTSDYTQALKTVRAWFDHADAYQILTDKY